MTTATVARPRRKYHRRDPLISALPENYAEDLDLDLTHGEIEFWRDAAICSQVDPNIFFPAKGHTNAIAKKLCRTCPVRQACLDHALHNGEHYGIWGGKSARERARLTTALGLPRVPTPRYFPVELVPRAEHADSTDLEDTDLEDTDLEAAEDSPEPSPAESPTPSSRSIEPTCSTPSTFSCTPNPPASTTMTASTTTTTTPMTISTGAIA